MDNWYKEYHISRILAGAARYRVGGTLYIVAPPTRENRFLAATIYRDARERAIFDGVFCEDAIRDVMMRDGLWSLEDEEALTKWEKDLENLKVGYFENRLRSNARLTFRTALKTARETIASLEERKHLLDHVTAEGVALSARYRFLIGSSLRLPDGQCYWPSGGWDEPDPAVDAIIELMASDRLAEGEFRELARSEPWRSIWGSGKQGSRGVIDAPASDLTEEQRNLLLWASVYDNIREHPDCPADDVVDDDDMLDGWLILQRRKRDAERASGRADTLGEGIGDEKMRNRIRNAEEVFLMADTVDDARVVDAMNDAAGSLAKAQKLAYLKQKGEVREEHMPDSKLKQEMAFTRLANERMRQLRG